MSKNVVTGDIFSYENLKAKAKREIERLNDAELKRDQNGIDFALNAAFSIYHLLQWRDKVKNPDSKKSGYDLCNETNNSELQMLHDIVTCTKHVTVSNPYYKNKSLKVTASASVTYFFTTEDGKRLITEDGSQLITEDSRLRVKFHNRKALDVLTKALMEFK